MEAAGGEQATWAHMRRAAKESAIGAWRDAWRNDEDGLRNGWFGPANHLTPSPRPCKHFYELSTNRRVFGLVTQCRTGHAFTGEYYSRFVPTESIACPCVAGLQTRNHILLHCERYDAHRHVLSKPFPSMRLKDILGTKKGIMALAKFISLTGAFTKTGDTILAQIQDHGQQ
ncbi:hypothetical protein BKA93DRAFT_723256 [Sparassis latifolia]